MPKLLADFRLAARSLARAKSSTALVLATIAIGVGGVSAVFSVVSALVLRPLPFDNPQQLVTFDVTSAEGHRISTSILNYRDWRDRARVFSSYGALAGWNFRLTGKGEAEVLSGEAALGDIFRVLAVTPMLGRVFTAAETEPGSPPLVVLGANIWQTKFGSDPLIIGTTITLDGAPHTVVGVLPHSFEFPSSEAQLYVNMGSIDGLPWDDRNSSFGTRIYARMKSGVSLSTAANDVLRIGREVKESAGADTALPSIRSLPDYILGQAAGQLWLLLAAVGLVLAVAFSNVGGLVLARSLDRRRDVAVRLAVGGGQRHIRRQFVAENVVLTIVGGTIGLGIAVFLVRALIPMLPSDLPAGLLERIAIDRYTVLATLTICLVAGIILGVAAAAASAPPVLSGALRSGSRGMVHSRRGARGALIVIETALSLVLAVESSLLLSSFLNLQKSDKGFSAGGVLTARVAASRSEFDTKERWLGYYASLLDRARALPGVTTAAISLLVPLTDRSWEQNVLPEGSTEAIDRGPSVLFNIISADYFSTLGVPLLKGRTFAGGDVDQSVPVAIIDETMAKQFWPTEDALGKRVTLGERNPDSSFVFRTVVGVTKNVRHYALATPSRIQIYIPLLQTYGRWGMGLNVILKSRNAPGTLIAPLRSAGTALDSRVPIWNAATAEEYISRSISGQRALGVITTWLAIVASLVTAVGLFGIVSYSVVQRRREIALRMALGAEQRAMVTLMTWNGVSLACVGVGLGLVIAAGLSRFVSTFLYGVKSIDLPIYAASATALLIISAAAAMIPALRARRLTPASVLREE
ncbi:MAG: ADOP family duplicated permease [Gemmatimonadaceae bacterium]